MRKIIALSILFLFTGSALAIGLGGLKLPSPKVGTSSTSTSSNDSQIRKTIPVTVLLADAKKAKQIYESIRASLDAKLKMVHTGQYENSLDDVVAALAPKYGAPLEWPGEPRERRLYWFFRAKNAAPDDYCFEMNFYGNGHYIFMGSTSPDCSILFKRKEEMFKATFVPKERTVN